MQLFTLSFKIIWLEISVFVCIRYFLRNIKIK